MKNKKLLNSEISYEIAKLGHTDTLCVCDAGFPTPSKVKKIDLAVTKNIPGFIEVLKTMLDEMHIEKVILANEIKEFNPKVLEQISKLAKNVEIEFIPHKEFKRKSGDSKAVIRTGECTFYANVILVAGVTFGK